MTELVWFGAGYVAALASVGGVVLWARWKIQRSLRPRGGTIAPPQFKVRRK